jgi:hypothetical protein
MHNRLTSRRRPATGSRAKAPDRQGNTIPAQGETQDQVPRMPHERDESADSQLAAEPSGKRLGRIAHDDVEQGQQDTGKGPALDATYNKLRK